ncbi:MAG: ATP-binding cassette domain-containing protein [Rhodothermaceae bacterium]
MNNYELKIESLTKRFGRRIIFENLSFEMSSGNIYGISGPNGSGKSTLVKILANLISPNSGKVIHKVNDEIIKNDFVYEHLGFVSPYLVMYDEFTAEENIKISESVRNKTFDKERVKELFEIVGLSKRRKDAVGTFSSGMKQRLKYVFALAHNPEFIIFDEATANLDDEGKEKVFELIKVMGRDRLVILASNESQELDLCKEVISLMEFKRK